MLLGYPARIVAAQDDGGYHVTFDDLPEAITAGDDEDEARSMAGDALEVALLGRIKDGMDVPAPRGAGEGEEAVALRPRAAAKVALYRAWRASGLSKVDAATRLGIAETEFRRMLDPHHPTKIERIDTALHGLSGERLLLSVEPA